MHMIISKAHALMGFISAAAAAVVRLAGFQRNTLSRCSHRFSKRPLTVFFEQWSLVEVSPRTARSVVWEMHATLSG